MAALRRRVTGDTSVDRRMAHLQAIQHELRERRRLDGLQHEENLGALDLLRERRRQALIAQQRKLSMSMRVSKVGDVPRNVKLPRKGLDSPRGIAGGASQM